MGGELPFGRYVVGEDIAAGRYVITAVTSKASSEVYVTVYDVNGTQIEAYTLKPHLSCKVTLKDGMTMVIDNDHGYEIHAKIKTMTGFMIQSSGYSLATEVVANTTQTVEVPETATPAVANVSQGIYTCLFDKWDLYKATVVSDSTVKIENWYRFNANDETPFRLDHSVRVVNPNDGSTDFKWLNDEHTAFSITLVDPSNSRFKEDALIIFTAGDYGETTSTSYYEYLHDKWDMYRATAVSDNVIKIDNWYRFNASEETPFALDHAVLVIITDDGSTDFKWLDEAHTSFSVTMSDKENSRFEEPSLALFTIAQ